MDIFILETGTSLLPFGDSVVHSRVRDMELQEVQERALRIALGEQVTLHRGSVEALQTIDVGRGECVWLTDDLWLTPALVEQFVSDARRGGRTAIVALARGLFTEFSAPLQDVGEAVVGEQDCVLYPLVWVPAGTSWKPEGDLALGAVGNRSVEPLVVAQDVQEIRFPVHRVFTPEEELVVPMTRLACVRLSHWMHILRANQLAQLAWGAELLKRPARLLGAVLRARSVNKWRVMEALTVRGKGCDIHPSAVVEASVLGEGVTVGANAVVRYSYLGDGVRVSDQCNILSTVLGAGASVARMGMLQSCVLYPKANSGHYGLQLCVVGRDTFVGGEVILGDFKRDGEVMVMHRA